MTKTANQEAREAAQETNQPTTEEIRAFQDDYQALSEKHGLDLAINYELTEDAAVKAKFVIVRKQTENNVGDNQDNAESTNEAVAEDSQTGSQAD